ncbi:MAG TPA: beta-propeller domain-containing protein [Streptosporangiaceae bacterium]|nr:beta-propeller domain-containing protein [Streptosporangiaceae bacterium]
MAARVVMSVLVAAGLAVAGCSGGDGQAPKQTERPQPGGLAVARLVSSNDCQTLLTGLREATAAQVGPYGLGESMRALRPLAGADGADGAGGEVPAAAAAPGAESAPAPGHSGTNIQEAGVDEPDLVKTDGRRIVAIARGRLYVVDAASHRVTGTLDLAGARGAIEGDLLLSGNRVLVVERLVTAMPPPFREGDVVDVPPRQSGGSRLTLVDISAAPRVVSKLTADGVYVDGRQVGSIARVVVRSVPRIEFPLPQPQSRPGAVTSPADRTRANQEIVRKAPLTSWLPSFQITRDGRTQTQRVPCGRVSHPPTYTGTSMLSVLTVDLGGDLGTPDPVSVVAGGHTVYATATSLYVIDTGGSVPPAVRAAPAQRTDIYKFDTRGAGRPRYVASGAVPGTLLGQYSLSEHGGNLRVATTTNPIAPPLPPSPGAPAPTAAASQSSVHVLAQRGDRLAPIGRLDGLGTGERIFAVRFVGTTGYVVTFRQIDPLYVLDLRDPRRPRTAGELKINGYSAYLHPAGNGLLIGVGQDATGQGRITGTQVSLFDVRDPAQPRRLSQYKVESGTSEVEFEPHAFLYRPDTGLTVLPVQRLTASSPAAGPPAGEALVLSVRGQEVRRLGMVRQPRAAENRPVGVPAIRRSLTIGTTLWTMSDAGLLASDATALTRRGWVPFG